MSGAAPPVALIAEPVWRTRFGGDPSIVGRSIRLDGVPHVIVGVMPPRFGFPLNARVWTPLALERAAQPGEGGALETFGRLADGATADRASRELSLEMSRLATAYPAVFTDHGARVLEFIELETPIA